MEIVHLDRGDVMIWREIIHSGDGYRTDNVRLFNSVLPTGYVEPRDANGELTYHTYAIEFSPSSQPPGQGHIPKITYAPFDPHDSDSDGDGLGPRW